jgi:hypothetical protein
VTQRGQARNFGFAREARYKDRVKKDLTARESRLSTARGPWSLTVEQMGRGFAWLNTGTSPSLIVFVRTLEVRQRVKIGYSEEIAFHLGFIDGVQFKALIPSLRQEWLRSLFTLCARRASPLAAAPIRAPASIARLHRLAGFVREVVEIAWMERLKVGNTGAWRLKRVSFPPNVGLLSSAGDFSGGACAARPSRCDEGRAVDGVVGC